ncbi:MAG: hypothetical protein CVV56_02195 [Tenericutes bacterium HGW-Tenericutes-1]|nr:MAG: hypothetical protein CVV56_02195 [Tenericutes bacterium HGW-Tenericutes-1]
MKNFFRRVFNTEFLPMSEVRKIKVILVMVFLTLVTAVTIPLSIFFDYELVIKIAVIAVLVLVLFLTMFLIKVNKIMASIQISIVYTIALAFFYMQGTSGFYAYLFFFIGLTVIVFYQELFSYLTYGTFMTALGIYYVIYHQTNLAGASNLIGSVYIYIAILSIFYLIFLLQVLYNEKLYTELNYEWVKMINIIDKYQDDTMSYLEDIQKQNKKDPLYENVDFQNAVQEVSVFIYEQFKEVGKEITNVLDLYIYIHEKGIDHILQSEELSVSTKKVAVRLQKYLLNKRTNMISIVFNFFTRFRDTAPYRENRYDYSLDVLAEKSDEQIIAVAMLYTYLSNEMTIKDQWGQISKSMTHDEIRDWFLSSEMLEFLSDAQIAFFKENEELFKEYLGKKV